MRLLAAFEKAIGAGGRDVLSAPFEPDVGLIYSPTTFTGRVAAWPGSHVAASGAMRLIPGSSIRVPGRGQQLAIHNGDAVAVDLIILALAGLPAEVAAVAGGTGGGSVADEKVKVTAADSTPSYLFSKLAAGDGITLTVLSPGADEDVQISAAGVLDDLATDTTETHIVSSVTETSVFSYTVPGATLSTNKLLELRIALRWLNSVDGSIPTIRVKYGATTILTLTQAALAASATPRYGILDVFLWGDGATNAQEGLGSLVMSRTTMVPETTARGEGTAAEDSTADKTLNVTIQLGSSNANHTATVKAVLLRGAYTP